MNLEQRRKAHNKYLAHRQKEINNLYFKKPWTESEIQLMLTMLDDLEDLVWSGNRNLGLPEECGMDITSMRFQLLAGTTLAYCPECKDVYRVSGRLSDGTLTLACNHEMRPVRR